MKEKAKIECSSCKQWFSCIAVLAYRQATRL